jgi:hypothetical protein
MTLAPAIVAGAWASPLSIIFNNLIAIAGQLYERKDSGPVPSTCCFRNDPGFKGAVPGRGCSLWWS